MSTTAMVMMTMMVESGTQYWNPNSACLYLLI
jgi:hypothetical protein